MCSIEGMSKDRLKKKESSDEGEGDTPVPIPNTEVKPFSADGTWLETTWESKTSLVSNSGPMVKRLRHRPFTAVTRVRIPVGSPFLIKNH